MTCGKGMNEHLASLGKIIENWTSLRKFSGFLWERELPNGAIGPQPGIQDGYISVYHGIFDETLSIV